MSDSEIDAVLDGRGHGVLSFDGSPPHSIPVSFGYDPDERVEYLHLVDFEGSEKARRLAESNRVSLVVSEFQTSTDWVSVVVDGHLVPIDDDIDIERVRQCYEDAAAPTIDVFDRPADDLDVRWFVLDPIEMAGRQGWDRANAE